MTRSRSASLLATVLTAGHFDDLAQSNLSRCLANTALSAKASARRLLAASSVLVLLLLPTSTVTAQPVLVTPEQWRSDIDFLASQLPKVHPNPFYQTPRDTFMAEIDALKPQVPQLSDGVITILLQQAVASLDDAHTEVDTRVTPNTYYPVRIDRLSDGFYVTRTLKQAAPACGAKVVAIDGIPIDDVLARVSTVISHENDQWVLARAPIAMARAEVLQALAVTPSPSGAIYTLEKGAVRFELELHPVNGRDANVLFSPPSSTAGWPLYMQNQALRYWYSWDADRGLMYVKYNVCQDDPAKPFGAFASEIFGIVDRSQVKYFVVDIRNNSGGDSAVVQPLIEGLRQRSQLRAITYVIIGRQTFSSGVIGAVDLLGVGAVAVGEPTGGKPNGYGEVLSFRLPNSGVSVFHSTKLFHFVPGDPDWIAPDVAVGTTGAEFFARRDPVLEAILDPGHTGALTSAGLGRRRAVDSSRTFACPQ